MKYFTLLTVILLSACSSYGADRMSTLEAERDFHAHQQYLESVYDLDNYDPEYVDDCLAYDEMVCEFE